jgi:hypothetical protein
MNFSNVKLPSNFSFGIFFTFIFTTTAVYFYFATNMLWTNIFVIISLILFLVTIIKAEILLPFNKLWMKFGFLIGMIISPIIIGIIFFVLITPFALVMRIYGRDELRLRLKKKNTHWKTRLQVLPQTNFKQQF